MAQGGDKAKATVYKASDHFPAAKKEGRLPTLADVAQRVKEGKVKDVVVMAGAGISTSAGIPDFRSPETGLYANLQKYDLPVPEAIFDIDYFQDRPEPFFTLAKELYPGNFAPTLTHHFFKLLHDKGVLRAVFTQNIDTLERIAGVPDECIIEAHGSFAEAECLRCHASYGADEIKPRIMRSEVVRCEREACQGRAEALIKPKIVFFGEGLPEKFFRRASDVAECDLLIVLGTSLTVHPFAGLMHQASGPRLLMNLEAVGEVPVARGRFSFGGGGNLGFDFEGRTGRPIRDVRWLGPCDEGVLAFADACGWRDDLLKLAGKDVVVPAAAEAEVAKDVADGVEASKDKAAETAREVAAQDAGRDEDVDALTSEIAKTTLGKDDKGRPSS